MFEITDYLGKIWKANITYYSFREVSVIFYSKDYNFNITITNTADNPKIVKKEIDKYVKIYKK